MFIRKNILVPVDFSDCSLNALKYAAGIAAYNSAKIYIINISDTGSLENELHGNLSVEHLAELLNKDEILKNVEHEVLIRKGNVIKKIVEYQVKLKSDLVVIGTHGANNLNRKLFGTNTTGIIEKSSCPVLAIPAGSVYKKIERVVLATDRHRDNMKKIEDAIDMIRPYKPELMLLHVSADSDPKVETDYVLSEIPGNVKKYVRYDNASMYISSYKKINEGIEHFILKKKADLLIMITLPRSFFQALFDKSKTKKIAFNPQIPLLAVPNIF